MIEINSTELCLLIWAVTASAYAMHLAERLKAAVSALKTAMRLCVGLSTDDALRKDFNEKVVSQLQKGA